MNREIELRTLKKGSGSISVAAEPEARRRRAGPGYSAVIESDFEREKFENYVDCHIPGMNSYGDFEEPDQYHICRNLANRIEEIIYLGKQQFFRCDLLIPKGLIQRIAQDAFRMSKSEPCGLRGCIIFINIKERNYCQKINKLVYDASCIPTFELYLTLTEDTKGWAIIKKILHSASGMFLHSGNTASKFICSGFQLEKKKLYRPNVNEINSSHTKKTHLT